MSSLFSEEEMMEIIRQLVMPRPDRIPMPSSLSSGHMVQSFSNNKSTKNFFQKDQAHQTPRYHLVPKSRISKTRPVFLAREKRPNPFQASVLYLKTSYHKNYRYWNSFSIKFEPEQPRNLKTHKTLLFENLSKQHYYCIKENI